MSNAPPADLDHLARLAEDLREADLRQTIDMRGEVDRLARRIARLERPWWKKVLRR